MKNFWLFWVIWVSILLSACSLNNTVIEDNIVSWDKSILENVLVDDSDIIDRDELLWTISYEDLSQLEIDSLLLMRQEEMLARDVYDFLYEKWGQKTFDNISDSEQTHMDTVWYLLNKYGIEDPIDSSMPWIYQSEELQSIYNELIDQWSKSLLDALIVGATVEDLDIKDLQDFLLEVDNEDIILAYQNLLKWSRNHLRSFIKQIERNGGEYSPQFISLDDYNAIIWAYQENYMVNSKGKNNWMWKHK